MLYAVRGLDNTATAAEAFSGPRNLSVLLFVLGVLGVVWSQMRPVGGGQAEDPARIMLVSREARPSLVSLLSNSGFDVVERSGEPGEATVDELIEAADHEGVGFVVIQTPTDGASGYVRGSPAEAEGDPWPEDARWVTVSVGDLAFPPKVRAGIDPSTNGYDEGESILGALFDQPRLAPERESLAHNPELKEVLLHAKLEPGLNISRRAESQRRLAYEMELRLAGRLLEGEGVRPLFEPLRIGGGLPVSDMEVLVTERALDFVIEADESMRDELDARISLQLWTLDGHGAEVGRRSCDALVGGPLRAESFTSLRASSDGAHLVMQLKDGTVRFFERVDGSDSVCGYRARGSAVVDQGIDVGVIGARGVVVGVAPGTGGGQLVFRDGDETWRTPEIAGVRLRNPTWFDDAHVLVTAAYDSADGHPRSGLLLVNALEPQQVARLELPLPLRTAGLHRVVVPRPGLGMEVIVAAGRSPTQLAMVELNEEPRWSSPAAVDPEVEWVAGASPKMQWSALTSVEVSLEAVLWQAQDAYDVAVGRGGNALIFATAGDEFVHDEDAYVRMYDIEALDLASARRGISMPSWRLQTGVVDRKPVYVPVLDGVLFSSRARLGVRRRDVTTPRIAPLGELSRGVH